MAAFDVTPRQLAPALRKLGDTLEREVIAGLRSGAVRVHAHINKVIIPQTMERGKKRPPEGATGLYKASWKVEDTQRGALLVNDAPYSGVIELGRRRGKWISRDGKKSLLLWLRRARGLDEKEAQRALYPVARSIKNRRIAGKFVGRRAVPYARRVAREEVVRALARTANEARP